MRACFDVGIDAQGDRRADILRSRDAIDVVELSFTFDVETEDAFCERVLDLLTRFADTCKRAARRIATCTKDTVKLAA